MLWQLRHLQRQRGCRTEQHCQCRGFCNLLSHLFGRKLLLMLVCY